MSPRTAIALLFVSVSLGCRTHDIVSGVTDSTFVAAMADLRRVQLAPGLDSARRSAMRDSVMRLRRVSSQQLEAAARRLAGQPDRAHDIWEAIDKRASPDTANKPT
jgi:hypothetical protein